MKDKFTVSLSHAELKTLRRIFNAVGGVPFHTTKKPALSIDALEKRVRALAGPVCEFDADEMETMLKAIDAIIGEFADEAALRLYVGCGRDEIAGVRCKLEAHVHSPV